MKRPCIGQVDTEAFDVPLNAFHTMRGFEASRGYPFTEKALAVYTTKEIRTSKRVRALQYWTDPDAASAQYAICDGGLWKIVNASAFTLLSTIDPGGTASRSSLTVTFSSIPNGTLCGKRDACCWRRWRTWTTGRCGWTNSRCLLPRFETRCCTAAARKSGRPLFTKLVMRSRTSCSVLGSSTSA